MSSDGGKKQFWKRNTAKVPGSIQHVYGAQHPPFDPLLHANLIKAGNKPPSTSTPGKPKKATTFQEFESITSDAWDVGDDDDELLAMAAQNLNIEVVMETANKVIENHSKLQERRQQQLDEVFEPEEKEEEEAHEEEENEQEEEEEAAETTAELSFGSERLPHSDSRLVKSHSEAPIGSPKEMTGDRAALQRQQSLPHRPVIPLVARMADQNTSGTPAMTEREASRLDKFKQLLAGPNTDLGFNERLAWWWQEFLDSEPNPVGRFKLNIGDKFTSFRSIYGLYDLEKELRKLSWSGIPRQVRPITWKLLSGYLPANAERRASTLQRKRQEYFGFIEQYYDSRNDEHHQDTYRQIHIDIPRTNPLIPLFQQASVQEIFERILFIWAIRHPASGYVQGINDLVTPFFVVYVFEYIEEEVENFDVSSLQEEVLRNIEADSFWCMSKLLDGIQVNASPLDPPPALLSAPGSERGLGAIDWRLILDTGPDGHPRRRQASRRPPGPRRGWQAAAETYQEASRPASSWRFGTEPWGALRHTDEAASPVASELHHLGQDNYTFAQPGIQRKVKALEELVSRIDETVHRHMQQYEVEYLQFAFRWMNNLLMRELPLRCTIRLWDTYQAEPEGFSHFHLYVCAAFLVRWRKEILEEKDFQGNHVGLMILLQNLPTMHWGNEEVSVLLAEAYRLKFAFADAPNHYKR
ncbi:hypothetical protein NFI96_024803 [Prochilodus magdalenae]|nr:hypothetical protein NFI96_024803 [Prochilodus magdalenae]